MLGALVLISSQVESAAAVYDALQSRLSKYQRLHVAVSYSAPPEKEIVCDIVRPNLGTMSGLNVYWKTDGRWTSGVIDGYKVDRPAIPGDLREMHLYGFESFYAPDAVVEPIGEASIVTYYGWTLLAFKAKIHGVLVTIGLDPGTRLPVYAGDAEFLTGGWYRDVRMEGSTDDRAPSAAGLRRFVLPGTGRW